MNPSAALQSTVEDFLDSLKETPGAAQAELVNCILRACGCNDTVNEDETVDYDGVVDALDNFMEALKQVRLSKTALFLPNILHFSG
jgi:cohesin complex subunit SA-1/2